MSSARPGHDGSDRASAPRAAWLDPLLRASARRWAFYLLTFLVMGGVVQLAAPYLRIARFAEPWQFATLYCGVLAPLALLLRERVWYEQYAYSLAILAPIEIFAFAVGSSLAYPDNVFDAWLGERNFTLSMIVLGAWVPYLGNRVIALLTSLVPAAPAVQSAGPVSSELAELKYGSRRRRG